MNEFSKNRNQEEKYPKKCHHWEVDFIFVLLCFSNISFLCSVVQ